MKEKMNKNRNLFEVEQEYLDIMALIEENDGEVTDEILEKLHINENEFKAKMKGYYYVLLQKKADIATLEERIEFFKKKVETIKKSSDAMRGVMADAIELYGEKGDGTGKKIKTAEISLWTVHHKPLIIEDENKFDNPEYTNYVISNKLSKEDMEKVKKLFDGQLVVTVEKNIDRKTLQADIKNGKVIEGASVDEDAKYLGMR